MIGPARSGDAAILANTTVTLAGLAVLGALLPLSVAGTGHTYAALFWPGSDALAGLSQSGAGWRLVRVLASGPVPILIVARGLGEGRRPKALLLPVPSSPVCLFIGTGL